MLIMNCIYKINRYDMFLLDIVDHIFINIIFYIDFAFIYAKKEKIYRWVLQQLKKLYKTLDFRNLVVIVMNYNETLINALKIEYFEITTLFCLFHINKNVRVWCRFEFDENEKNFNIFYAIYERLMYAHDKFAYRKIMHDFENEYYRDFSNFYEHCYDYVRNIWIILFRNKMCKVWINRILHFDTTIISRVEIMYRVLKSMIKFSTSDLMIVVNDIEIMIMNQLMIYRIDIEKKKWNDSTHSKRQFFNN